MFSMWVLRLEVFFFFRIWVRGFRWLPWYPWDHFQGHSTSMAFFLMGGWEGKPRLSGSWVFWITSSMSWWTLAPKTSTRPACSRATEKGHDEDQRESPWFGMIWTFLIYWSSVIMVDVSLFSYISFMISWFHPLMILIHVNDFNWLVVWNRNLIFPYIGNNHPNWRTHMFQRGRVEIHQPVNDFFMILSSKNRHSKELPMSRLAPVGWNRLGLLGQHPAETWSYFS